jgi:hypothetical protein
MLAPIVLFVYNRPKHTSKVLEALKANPEAKKSDLFIYCDGPRDNSPEFELEQIEETRKIARSISGFKKIFLTERKQNKGLAASIIEGVTEIVNQYGRIIVLEDDIVTSKGFLKYMNEGLNCYENTNRVMQISGYVFPFHTNFNYLDTFFYKPGSCWGWGTWKKAWSHFEKSPLKLMNELSHKKLWDEFTVYGTYPSYKTQIEQNISGQINTWAIFWYGSMFLQGGTTLMPTVSIVQNIGLDGSGENSGEWTNENPFYWKNLAENIPIKKKWNYASKNENRMLRNAFREKLHGNLFKEKSYSLRDHFYLMRKKIILKFFSIFQNSSNK